MSVELLNKAYGILHWRREGLFNQLRWSGSTAVQSEIDKLDRLERRIEDRLGYSPRV